MRERGKDFNNSLKMKSKYLRIKHVCVPRDKEENDNKHECYCLLISGKSHTNKNHKKQNFHESCKIFLLELNFGFYSFGKQSKERENERE